MAPRKQACERGDGFVKLSEVLACRGLRGVSVQKVKEIVAANDKQRFALAVEHGETIIRANQGHSIEGVCVGFEAVGSDKVQYALHGTYVDEALIGRRWHASDARTYAAVAKAVYTCATLKGGKEREADPVDG